MNSNIFKIDYKRLVRLLLPTVLRNDVILAYLDSLVIPIKALHAEFSNNRSINLYKITHNGQVCYLRAVLNDTFDNELRRIKVAEGNIYPPNYIYTEGEKQNKYLGKIFIRPANEYGNFGVDFRVIIPDGFNLTANYYQMKATIDFYKLASKRYKIQYENE